MTETSVLLVEDDTGIGRMLERGLTTQGFCVDWVRDLHTAIERVREGDHQIVVLDRMLPDGDGSAFCSALRKFGSTIPVCMLTARDSLDDKLSGFHAGADDYLTKPFEFDELLVRLQALLRRAKPPAPEAFLDPASRTFRCGKSRIRFTKREYPLFNYLLDNRGEGVSRTEILSNAWGVDGEVTENSVDVYVGYLRRKLTDAGLDFRIETLRGLGFMLIAPEDVSVTIVNSN
ncbi:response regulator transcription factor [Rhodobacteraceae bacterium NNCM2]|nr:response regulator transcription factor [Coraliihabitans acroporae]